MSKAWSKTIQDLIVKFRVPTQKYVPKRLCSKWSKVWSKMIQDQIVNFRFPTLKYVPKEFALKRFRTRLVTSESQL